MKFRNNDQDTSHESARNIGVLAAKLRSRIIEVARAAGREGITANECERTITEHKSHSITPRFAELLRSGALVRVLIGYKATPRFPNGRNIFQTRWDAVTQRNVLVHWLPEFAPLQDHGKDQAELFERERAA